MDEKILEFGDHKKLFFLSNQKVFLSLYIVFGLL